jgi:hypothetical protein
MNSNTFLNRAEILLYSTLISAMSGINHLRTQIEHLTTIPVQHSPDGDIDPTLVNDQYKERSLLMHWKTIQQSLLQLLLWIILGFAAGYLIGMIKPR